MHKLITPLIAVFFLTGNTSNLQITSTPSEVINSPSGKCEVSYYYNIDGPEEISVTEVLLFCGIMETVVWRAEGAGHQLTLEWLSDDSLKINHPTALDIQHQEVKTVVYHDETGDKDWYVSDLIIEYDPPYEEPPEPEMLNEANWPTDCDEAAKIIYSELDEESRAMLTKDEKSELIKYHFGWGMGIRNNLGLWRDNNELINSCMAKQPNSQHHPDTVSTIIMELVWELTQENK